MTTRPLTDRIDPRLSERLSVARVLCILGMIWVHVPGAPADGADRILDLADPAATLRAFLVEGVGRSSAALLSVVSGWLCAHLLLGGRAPRALIGARARLILVPMLFWASVTVALYALVSTVRPTFLSAPGPVDAATVLRWIDSVAFLSSAPSGPTMHLSFLRDLFVCTCLAPALLALIRRWPRAVMVALGAFYLADLESPLVLRPLVLFAFAIGLWLAHRRVRLDAADAHLGWWIGASIFATVAVMLANAGAFAAPDAALASVGLDLRESVLYPLSRLFGSLAVWTLAARLVGTRAGGALAAQMPWLFTTYCSHFLVLGLLWAGLLAPLGASGTAPGFTLWFLAAPLVALLVGRAIVRLTLARWPPGAVALGLRPRHARVEPTAPGAGAAVDAAVGVAGEGVRGGGPGPLPIRAAGVETERRSDALGRV